MCHFSYTLTFISGTRGRGAKTTQNKLFKKNINLNSSTNIAQTIAVYFVD